MSKIDTSPEAVGRLAAVLEEGEWDHAITRGPNPTSFCAPDHPAPKQAAATLRALAADVGRLLKVLNEIEECVSASMIGNPFAEIERLRSIARAALAQEPRHDHSHGGSR